MPDWKSRLRSLLGQRTRDVRESEPAPGPALPEAPASGSSDTLPEPTAAPSRRRPRPPRPRPPRPRPRRPTSRPLSPCLRPRSAAAPADSSREVQLEEEVRRLRDGLRAVQEALTGERATRARLEEEIRALADQDPLTGLASARRFGDRLTVAIVHAQRHKQKLAVVQLGVDGFARVNERLGRSHGDDLLRSVALALESTLRQGDTIARATGDVFTVLLPGIKRDEDVTVIADKLRLALRSPFSIGGHDLLVTASLGIALFPDDGPDTDTLLQSATVAMKRAKQKGGDAWDVHAPRSRALAAERQATETQLRRALLQGELELYWQPVVECETGRIVSLESLLRWRREQGVERAADFVSLADVAGLAVPLGQWTLRAACVQGRKWQDAGHTALVVSVNISQRQLAHASLVKLVRRVLDETGLPPECLELDVRESELQRNPDLAIERLTELRKLGLRIALDDFGTGESRLTPPLPLSARRDQDRRLGGERRGHEPRPRGGDQRRGRARSLAAADGGGGGRRDRGAAREPGALAVRPDAGQPVRAARPRRRDRAAAAAPAPGGARADRGRHAEAAAALVLRHGRDARVSGEEPRGWYLETVSEGGTLRRVRIGVLPFRVGRRHGLELVLPAESVSKLHAEIYAGGQGLRLRDLGSRNGSFVNRVQVEDTTLVEGDVVHFADFEFRVGRSDLSDSKPESGPFVKSTTVAVKRPGLPHRFAEGTRELRELLREDQVTMVFQPIVLLARGTVVAYEALGRGLHPGLLGKGPLELLQIAESIGRRGRAQPPVPAQGGRARRATAATCPRCS